MINPLVMLNSSSCVIADSLAERPLHSPPAPVETPMLRNGTLYESRTRDHPRARHVTIRPPATASCTRSDLLRAQWYLPERRDRRETDPRDRLRAWPVPRPRTPTS